MSKFIIGGDTGTNTGSDCLAKAQKVFEEAGHTVENKGVGPGFEGKISGVDDDTIIVFFVNGAGVVTPYSFYQAFGNKAKHIWFAYTKNNDRVTCDALKNTKFSKCNGGEVEWDRVASKYKSLTGLSGCEPVASFFNVDKIKKVMSYTCDGYCEELAKKILNGTGEGGGSTDGTSTGGSETVMSGWESLCDLMKPLDGLAMMVQRGDTVIVRRIEVPGEPTGDASIVSTRKDTNKDAQGNPIKNKESDSESSSDETTETTENQDIESNIEVVKTQSTKTNINNPTKKEVSLYAYEGVNIVADSVTISDYSPEIYNTLDILWGENYENSFTLCFERHKELFGERRTEIQACNEEVVVTEDEDGENKTDTDSSSNSSNDNSEVSE